MADDQPVSLIGCCGLYCGLCSKYQSKAPGRCVGCKLGEQHAWCSIWNCCVRRRGLETCAECDEIFRCEVFLRRKVAEWVPASRNLHQIKEFGLEKWLAGQRERQALVEELLQNYNEGRSMGFYCRSCANMPVELIQAAVKETDMRLAGQQASSTDMKSKARVLKAAIRDLALKANVALD
jgi:hypothetical protein